MKFTTTLFLLFFFSLPLNANVIFVKQNATGNNDGTSWLDAFNNLQTAIGTAQAGDSIWVTLGVYKPTEDNNRNISFVLETGIQWYGGFDGTETMFDERNPNINITTLSGNIGLEGDSLDNSYTVVYTAYTDSTSIIDGFTISHGNANSDSINDGPRSPTKSGGGLYVLGEGTGNESTPIIRHCMLKNNYARNNGGALFLNGTSGGSASPTIFACLFDNNNAQFRGGGVSKEGGNTGPALQNIDSCIFSNNSALIAGGFYYGDTHGSGGVKFNRCQFIQNSASQADALSIDDNNLEGSLEIVESNFLNNGDVNNSNNCIQVLSFDTIADLKIINSYFEGNLSSNSGVITIGAIFFQETGGKLIKIENSTFYHNEGNGSSCLSLGNNVALDMNNCMFYNNITNDLGATIRFSGRDVIHNITNTSFVNNQGLSGAGGAIDFASNGENRTLNLYNSIFWKNQTDSNIPIENIRGNSLAVNLFNSLISLENCDSFIYDTFDEYTINCENNIYNQNPQFVDSLNQNFNLKPCSPAVNAGDNSFIDSLTVFDIVTNDRVSEDIVDIGPFEVQSPLSISNIEIACFDDFGSVEFNFTGGIEPLSYIWDNGTNTGTTTTDLLVGNYQFTVTDAENCSRTIEIEIINPLPVTVGFTTESASTSTSSDGTISIDSIAGGTAPYNLIWSNGADDEELTDLSPDTYILTVTDANNCIFVFSVEVGFTSSNNLLDKNTDLSIFPNLVNTSKQYVINIKSKEIGNIKIETINTQGSQINEITISKNTNDFQILMTPPNTSGIYFIRISLENTIQVFKLMVTE